MGELLITSVIPIAELILNFMKKVYLTLTGMALFFSACSTESENPDAVKKQGAVELENQVMSMSHVPFNQSEDIKLYKDAMKEVLIMAKNRDFQDDLLENALLQKNGDYDVTLEDLSASLKKNSKFQEGAEKLAGLSESLNAQNGIKPLVFYPRAETIEKKGDTRDKDNSNKSPIAVFRNVYNDDYASPGYALGEDDKLKFVRMVTEEYAWNHDVYVIGDVETMYMEPTDPWSGGGGTSYTYRDEGHYEVGGIIQVTDLNEIEHWTAGKLEFRYVVVSGKGVKIKDKQFPQRARSNFNDGDWYDFGEGDFIYNWYTQNIGEYCVENWIETDGGKSASITINVPAIEEGAPSYSITVPSEEQDDNLGLSIVQFPDRLGLVYGISYMNFKRR